MASTCLAPGRSGVAQVSNLLYRRFPIGRLSRARACTRTRTARRLEGLRYSRLETCATLSTYHGKSHSQARFCAVLAHWHASCLGPCVIIVSAALKRRLVRPKPHTRLLKELVATF